MRQYFDSLCIKMRGGAASMSSATEMIRFASHAAAVINAWPFHPEAAGGGDEFDDHVGHAHSLPRENGQTMASRIPKHPVGVPVRVLRSNGP